MNVTLFDFSRGLDIAAVAVWAGCGLLGAILGAVVKVKQKDGTVKATGIGGVEALLLALIGGILARVFIWLLMLPLSDLSGGSIVLGHLFFLIPSIVDDFIALGGSRVLTAPEGLLFLATLVGSFVGMMDGIWRIHDWKGFGWLSFPLDMTWGLAGLNYALLLHLVNFAWGDHATETRKNAHRYKSGFRIKSGYAFTQGSVMSNLNSGPPASDSEVSLFRHEKTHVWQNRWFGPFFTLTYIWWMIFWAIPGLIAGAATKDSSGSAVGAGSGAERLSYYNCPWEVWAYAVHPYDRESHFGPELIWGALPVILLAIPICGGLVALLIALYAMML